MGVYGENPNGNEVVEIHSQVRVKGDLKISTFLQKTIQELLFYSEIKD